MSHRFTLRKEYFGGLVYDSTSTSITILDAQDYEILIRAASNAIDFDLALPSSREKLNRFIKNGFLKNTQDTLYSLYNTRIIPTPTHLDQKILSAPIRVFDSYTRKCNLKCDHCYFSSSTFVDEERRTIQQTIDILNKFYDVGTMEWRFTGGEALVHPDLFEAINTAKEMGFNVGLYTNGWWGESIADKIFGSGLNTLSVSLEGTEDINDKRRRRGSYKEVLKTFDRISNHNKQKTHKKIAVTIATAVGKDNVECVPFLARLAASYGFNINFMPLKPSGRARQRLQNEMLSTEEYMVFSKTVQKMRDDPNVRESEIEIIFKYKDLFNAQMVDKSGHPFPFNYDECGALTTSVSMMPDGTLFSCPFILDVDPDNRFVGPNINEMTVSEAWLHPNFQDYRNASKTNCLDCDFYRKQCRGKCRATVLGHGGAVTNGKLVGDDLQCFASLLK